MKILTPQNDTRNDSTEYLIEYWANALFDATALKRDYALRTHFLRMIPHGLRSRILVREAEVAMSAKIPIGANL